MEIHIQGIDHKNTPKFMTTTGEGLSEHVVRSISKEKNEPEWMLNKRLKSLELFNKTKIPTWGPNLSNLDLNKIVYYAKPDAKKNANKWEDLPADIQKTFEKLGIPEAERNALAGAGTQYESEVVYHKLKEEWEKLGVIFENCDVALHKHPELFKKYFMTNCVPISDHKFVMLHGAVWSGGTFIYVPPNVKVNVPLQAYFRMNAPGLGQFEHTLIIADKGSEVNYIEGCSMPLYNNINNLHAGCVEIYVHEGARVRYNSVENWSKKTYNLNTKRAIVDKNGTIEWINGNTGSATTMLYPCSILKGEGAKSDFLGVAFASKDQNQDTGAKIIHLAPHTTSTTRSKSISKDGGITTFRGLLKITKNAHNCKANVNCDALMMDAQSKSDTIPFMEIKNSTADIAHEATVGRISAEQLFYLMSRGLSEEQAMQMIVSGFIEPIVKELPLEYAIELNKLIQLEMDGSLG
ncbi:MAG TPA: Fe-S cluster assembly protein SufB [Candidatus Nanoarchaeia archaeon]|nr:Fe-S cluster assembly protein SufB [Candidatus Nanoarchaeia archaeon]